MSNRSLDEEGIKSYSDKIMGVCRAKCAFASYVFSNLVVEERKSRDEIIKAIESRRDQVLGVVTEQLQGRKHGKTSMLKFWKRALLRLIGGEVGLAGGEVTKESIVVNGSDEEEHLGPAKSRNGIDGSHTVWDISERKSRGDFAWPAEDLRHDVSKDAELANTSVLKKA